MAKLQGKAAWFKHGFLNTLEQGITRVADGLTTLFLIWFLSPELFSKLAMAQAMTAPLLLFFVAPETVLYRDFSIWKKAGPSSLASRLHVFRAFGYGKGQLAVVISLITGALLSGQSYWEWVFSLIWAFSLALAPQIAGPDREFLRLSLQLEALNLISLYQKLVLFVGTVGALQFIGHFAPHFNTAAIGQGSHLIQLASLAGIAAFSAVSTAVFARAKAIQYLRKEGATETSLKGRDGPGMFLTLTETLKDFSIWQHLQGVILNWVQTMDLFCLGLFHFPARQIGLYASVLKLVNFSNFAPLALTNVFGIWIGRKLPEKGHAGERAQLKRLSFFLFLGVSFQGLIFMGLGPYLIDLLSHGRWAQSEEAQMVQWFNWVLLGNVILTSTYLLSHWALVRSQVLRAFTHVYLPWGVLTLGAYSLVAYLSAQNPLWVARMNGGVALLFCLLLFFFYRRLSALASMGDR